MTTEVVSPTSARQSRSRLDVLYRLSVVALAAIMVSTVLLLISQSAVYKIHEYERGLHLRGGRFLAVDEPGWHVQIPYVDTVIIVKVNERLGYVERISAVTADNLTMVVSLQYTYKVSDPRTYALAVDDPERILFEFVQGKLRDVANRQSMTAMMNNRATFNETMLTELRTKEQQYGVQFITVQIQSAEPPANVVSAIEDRMVAVQRQEQAEAEAAQQKVLADANFYTAQKQADAEAYQIKQRAAAQQESIRLLLGALSQHPDIASKYLDYLMTQELKNNSKWVIGQPGSAPIIDLRPETETNP
ncbi:MAG TPA: SPFH domain-containing protein [Anaerolineales bacterium]|nr:SPFH domain-containing protein [Anaerolineales bacterium]